MSVSRQRSPGRNLDLESKKEEKMGLIKVAIADPDTLLREGLKRILAAESDLLAVGEAADGV